MSRIGIFVCVILFAASRAGAALGDESLMGDAAAPGALPLVQNGMAAPLVVSGNDWPGVQRAAGDLQADIARVTGATPALDPKRVEPVMVLIGTLGRSELIDGLVAGGKLNADAIRGKWESFIIETVEHPLPGVD